MSSHGRSFASKDSENGRITVSGGSRRATTARLGAVLLVPVGIGTYAVFFFLSVRRLTFYSAVYPLAVIVALLSVVTVEILSDIGSTLNGKGSASARPLPDRHVDARGHRDEQDLAETNRRAGVDLRPLAVMAAAIIFSFAMGRVPFAPAAVVFLVVVMVSLGERRWWLLASVPAGLLVGCYGVFEELLKVRLP